MKKKKLTLRDIEKFDNAIKDLKRSINTKLESIIDEVFKTVLPKEIENERKVIKKLQKEIFDYCQNPPCCYDEITRTWLTEQDEEDLLNKLEMFKMMANRPLVKRVEIDLGQLPIETEKSLKECIHKVKRKKEKL